MSGKKPMRTPMSRVFTIEQRAGPANVPVYQGQAMAGAASQDFGDLTPVREPDPDRYGGFKIVDTIRGERGLPTLSVTIRYNFALSAFLRFARIACPLDVQVHMGICANPQDFNGGWEKNLVLEAAQVTTWGTDPLGALEQGQDAVVNEEVPLSALDMYEIVRVGIGEIASAEVVQEIVDVEICDSVQCGACGVTSDGCSTFFAITLSSGGSPGLPAEVIASQDGGTTIVESIVTSLAANEDPSELACVGIYLVVVSNDSDSLHYAPLADILAGTETWVEMPTGFVAAGSPNAIHALDAGHVWIVGDGGYVYFTDDVTAAVEIQDAGAVTTENLNSVHGCDTEHVVAVGENNAVIYSEDGGETWQSVTGPAVGVVLNTVWQRNENEWFIGDAGGNLWYTQDKGVSWTQKAFPGDGAGQVRDIKFATPTVGYLAHDTATPLGRILRTIDGGHSWYVLPEGTGSGPANDQYNAIAACGEDVNTFYAGGLNDDGTDGFLVKGAGA